MVVCSHLGRPGGQVDQRLRMAPVAASLSEIAGFEVASARDTVGPEAADLVDRCMAPGTWYCWRTPASIPARHLNDPGIRRLPCRTRRPVRSRRLRISSPGPCLNRRSGRPAEISGGASAGQRTRGLQTP